MYYAINPINGEKYYPVFLTEEDKETARVHYFVKNFDGVVRRQVENVYSEDHLDFSYGAFNEEDAYNYDFQDLLYRVATDNAALAVSDLMIKAEIDVLCKIMELSDITDRSDPDRLGHLCQAVDNGLRTITGGRVSLCYGWPPDYIEGEGLKEYYYISPQIMSALATEAEVPADTSSWKNDQSTAFYSCHKNHITISAVSYFCMIDDGYEKQDFESILVEHGKQTSQQINPNGYTECELFDFSISMNNASDGSTCEASVSSYSGHGNTVIKIQNEYFMGPVTHVGTLCSDDDEVEEVILPDTIAEIGTSAFSNMHALKRINFPKINYIPDQCFENDTALESFDLEGIKTLGAWAFKDCKALTGIDVSKVESIGDNAFSGCDSITELDLSGTNNFGINAIADCHGLKKATLPEGIVELGEGLFMNCDSLESVTIPSSVVSIKGAFRGCTALTEVVLPEGLTTLDDAFVGCTGITKITLPSTLTTVIHSFEDSPATDVTVPEGLDTSGFLFMDAINKAKLQAQYEEEQRQAEEERLASVRAMEEAKAAEEAKEAELTAAEEAAKAEALAAQQAAMAGVSGGLAGAMSKLAGMMGGATIPGMPDMAAIPGMPDMAAIPGMPGMVAIPGMPELSGIVPSPEPAAMPEPEPVPKAEPVPMPTPVHAPDFTKGLVMAVGDNGNSYLPVMIDGSMADPAISGKIPAMISGNTLSVAASGMLIKKNIFTGEETRKEGLPDAVIVSINSSIEKGCLANENKLTAMPKLSIYLEALLTLANDESMINEINSALNDISADLKIIKNESGAYIVTDSLSMSHSMQEIFWKLSFV